MSYYSSNTNSEITRIFIIRHGQTDHNIQKIFQGHRDIPINQEGFEQADKLGEFLKNKKHITSFDKIYSSDLIRCKQTLGEILKNVTVKDKDKDIEYSQALRERYMGIIEGMHLDAAEKYALENGKTSFRDYGETLDEFHKRLSGKIVDIFENDISDEHINNIAIISHGGAIRNILHWLDKINDYYDNKHKVVVYNTSVTIVDFNNKTKTFEIKEVGNTDHLGEGQFVVQDTKLR
ncbi:hypothetical protein ACO0RG_004157 [Hanseniaspora osmophila]